MSPESDYPDDDFRTSTAAHPTPSNDENPASDVYYNYVARPTYHIIKI